MMRQDELCYRPAFELARAVRERALSAVEVVEAFLARIEAINPAISAFCTIVPKQARAAAQEAERRLAAGEPTGPLHGVPIAFKDLTPTAGVRTTFGSKLYEHHVPTEDAGVVARVKAAGAIVLGKTNTPEFGCKGVTDNRLFGITRNPWNPALTAGGSSGGAAAALAAGLTPLAEGSDLAGSIRIPAAMCGVVGLKPTPGRVSKYPSVNGWDSMLVYGPMARTVRDVALLLSAMAGYDQRDPVSVPSAGEDFLAACDQPIGRVRIGWSYDLGYALVDPRVKPAVDTAARTFAALGCDVEEATPGFTDPEGLFLQISAIMHGARLGEYLAEWGEWLDPLVRQRMALADRLTAVNAERLQYRRTELYRTVQRFFERYDLLLTPTIAIPPFPVDAPYPLTEIAGQPTDSAIKWYPFTFPFNLTGNPAISIPAGWTDDGLPLGLQIVGRRFAEADLLRVSAAFEQTHPWTNRRPHFEPITGSPAPHLPSPSGPPSDAQ